MPMSSGGHVASSSECATRPEAREIGLTGCAVPTQHSSPIGRYVMAAAEHREPCDSRGSCTILGALGGETPPSDSSVTSFSPSDRAVDLNRINCRPAREPLAPAPGVLRATLPPGGSFLKHGLIGFCAV